MNKPRDKRFFVVVGLNIEDNPDEAVVTADKWWRAANLAETVALELEDNEFLRVGVVGMALPHNENDPREAITMWCPVEDSGKINMRSFEEGLEALDKVEDDIDRKFFLNWMPIGQFR